MAGVPNDNYGKMGCKEQIVTIAVALPLHETYCYSVPDHLVHQAIAGKRVLVPFGKRTVTGYLLGPGDQTDLPQLRHILDVLDDTPIFPAAMIPFFRWIADYYMHPLGMVIHTALPAGLNLTDMAVVRIDDGGTTALGSQGPSPIEKRVLDALVRTPSSIGQLKKAMGQPVSRVLLHRMQKKGWIRMERRIRERQIRPKTVKMVSARTDEPIIGRLSAKRQTILDRLKTEGDLSVASLSENIHTAPALVRAMEKAGQVTVHETIVCRDPFGDPIAPDTPPTLTDEQCVAVDTMAHLLGKGFETVLLAGVTGSGKTEVYLRLAETAMNKDLRVLVLVPEIALISQTERRFRARFGETVAVLHSGLSKGERYDQWQRIAKGEARIAVGVRSSIFAPFDDLGLIVVDEEHDPSYKQEGGLHYNARDLAVVLARHHDALVVLGSATPSVQSWHNVTVGKYKSIHLTQRINRHPLPAIQTVDLSQSRDDRGIDRFITPPLKTAIRETLAKGDQALIFLNRRGFSASPVCGHCGNPIRCKNCDISLTLHKRINAFLCHYCGFTRAASSNCPSCGSDKIRLLGVGTEKIQEALENLFPGARVARMDKDTMARKGSMVKLLKDLKQRRIDILVGTQMVAKGHDFSGITLVGIICADLTLNFPDFRSGERTFQLLAQVAGRAGRGKRPGKVILQTYNPNHFSILSAKKQNFMDFFKEEIGFRRMLGYPPFTRMVAVRISGKNPEQTAGHAHGLGERFRELKGAMAPNRNRIKVMGPIEAPLARIANHYRWQILVMSPDVGTLRGFFRRVFEEKQSRSTGGQVRVAVDVDPFFLM